MLILTRKLGQSIYVGEGENQIKITVVLIERGKVRIGINAPKTVSIMREELLSPPDREEVK